MKPSNTSLVQGPERVSSCTHAAGGVEFVVNIMAVFKAISLLSRW